MQSDATVMGSLAHADVAMAEATLTDTAEDVAEDVYAVQIGVSARCTATNATATLTATARTREVSARHVQQVTRKLLPSRI